ncbi:Ltp family lipoprotein [Companilactobacillus furfuricola]|uniref:Ltp family lipoprotein n=1 Tax=Companilactobacillus furfuricola TaxID=1462575 RepID=UPI000F7962B0|nr:Ltp family lipoprotein [Companilactobacillus furfuricola]
MKNQDNKKKRFFQRWWFWVLVAVVIFSVGASFGGSSSDESKTAGQSEKRVDGTNAFTKEHKPENDVPKEYESALKSAKTYSSFMHMSKMGIHDQLTSEYGGKFTEEAANYALENLDADYNKNALSKAKTYQDDMAMSPEAIHDQLTSEYGEKFTPEEADYAIAHLPK